MRRSLYSTVALMGLTLMLAGAATTYSALGQDGGAEVVTEVPEMTEEALPSETVVEQAAPVQVESVQQQNPAPVVVPTLPSPTVLPPTPLPPTATPMPTVEPAVPAQEGAPANAVTAPLESPAQSSAAQPPTVEQPAPVETEVPVEATEQVIVPADSQPQADPVVDPPAENAAPSGPQPESTEIVQPPAGEGAAPVGEVVPVESQPEATEVVAPPVVEGAAPAEEAVIPEATEQILVPEDKAPVQGSGLLENSGAQNVGAGQPESVFTATPDLPAVQPEGTEEPAVGGEPTEMLPEEAQPVDADSGVPQHVEATEAVLADEPAAESTEAVLAAGALVSGQVNDQLGKLTVIQLSLTSPAGEVATLMTGEQGMFVFEGLGAGDYVLEASAPGFISRQMQFTLAEGQQLELPLSTLSAGDLNLDNRVDLNDIVLIAANYDGPAIMLEADLNGDEWIDISDLAMLGAQFGAAGPMPWA